jgi:DNA-directed RNA polymerase subunit RPC12/RpoP
MAKSYHVWKCQKCGTELRRVKADPPKRCERCLDRGVKTYVGKA